MSEKLSLPASSYDEMIKIIKGYSNTKGPASLDDIAKLVGMNRTRVSANNKFFSESGLIQGGNKKTATSLGSSLGRALDHNQIQDIQDCWKKIVSANENIAGLVTTIRIKGGMTSEELAAHILYVSGQTNNKGNRTGANALVEILKASGLIELADDKIVVAQPNSNDESEASGKISEDNGSTLPMAETPQIPAQNGQGTNQPVYQVATQANPQIAINIQLHLPETDNPEVYKNLFKALILDCPFDSSDNMLKRAVDNLRFYFLGYEVKLPGRKLLKRYAYNYYVQFILKWFLKSVSSMDYQDIETFVPHMDIVGTLEKITTPCFFINCKNDEKVPIGAAKNVYSAPKGFKRLWITNGRNHYDSFFYNPEKYSYKINRFVDKVLTDEYKTKKIQKIFIDK